MSKVIEVTVSPRGETQIETKGFAGQSCRDATKSLEKALGLRQAEQLTAEFHVAADQSQQQTQGH